MAAGDRWFFDRIAGMYDVVTPPAARRSLETGLSMADGPVERLLDVGGGTGRAARALDVPERVVVDASAGMLRRVPAGLDPVLASATDLPVSAGAVDVVVIVDALHHLPDHDRVLAEADRALRPGGVLVVREFDRGTLRGRVLEAAEHLGRLGSTFLTADGIRDRLEAAGFEATVLEAGFSCTVVGHKSGTA